MTKAKKKARKADSAQVGSQRDGDAPRTARWLTVMTNVAMLLAACALVSLAVRPIASVDLGYHLAYGEVFLDTGRIVDDASFVYPVPTPNNAGTDRFELAPGAYFDAEGRYRFPNANWLTQVILALAWRGFGWGGLNALLVGLVVLIAAGQCAAVRRLGLPIWTAAFCWLALAAVGHTRFLLRPELFAFALLSWQFAVLVDGRFSRKAVAAAVLMQLAAVNLHSYWLLGAGIVAAFCFESLIRLAWDRLRKKPDDGDARGAWRRRGICLGLMLLAACVHPSGPSNALYPFKTLRYMAENHISGLSRQEASEAMFSDDSGAWHPWQSIGEFYSPFTPQARKQPAFKGYVCLLGFGAAAAAIALRRRHWAFAAIVAALSAASLGMGRNMIIPALAVPVIVVWATLRVAPAHGRRGRSVAAALVAALLIAVSALLSWAVMTNRFYALANRKICFGLGPSPVTLPLEACRTLDDLLDEPQPVFVNQSTTSSVVFFSDKAAAAPTLTNTWASPPAFMARSQEICSRPGGLGKLEAMGFRAVVLQGWPENVPLINSLLDAPDWALVDIDGWFCTFLRRGGDGDRVIAGRAITAESLRVDDLIDAMPANPAARQMRLEATAMLLQSMRWYGPAETVWEAFTQTPAGADKPSAWLNLGLCKALYARQLFMRDDLSGIDRLRRARDCFLKALELQPDYRQARINLRNVENDLAALKRAGF